MNALKNTVKAVVPTNILNYGRKIRDRSQLSAIPALNFDTSNLLPASKINIGSLLNDPDTQAPWETDRKAVSEIFGDNDKYGGVNPGDRQALHKLLCGLKPQTVLEVGTHIGASTLYIARALKTLGTSTKVTTVDIVDVNDGDGPWRSVGLNNSPQQFAEQLDCAEHIQFVKSPCVEYMLETNQKFDLIFLDGDHSAAAVYQEVSAALNVLNPDGVILMHDYYPLGAAMYADNTIITGPYLAIERIQSEAPEIMLQPLGALPWPTKQGSNLTSLAILTKA